MYRNVVFATEKVANMVQVQKNSNSHLAVPGECFDLPIRGVSF